MTPFLSSVLSFVLLHKYYALFLIATVSAAGVPLPLDVITVATGAFVSQGYLSSIFTAIALILGNTVGDAIDYFIARFYENKFLREKYLHKFVFFREIEDYLNRYAALTIIFSRFVGIMSVPTNLLSGYTKIKAEKFIFYDLVGNTLASLFLFFIGFFVGEYWEQSLGTVSLITYIIAISILIFALYHIFFIRKRKRREAESKRE